MSIAMFYMMVIQTFASVIGAKKKHPSRKLRGRRTWTASVTISSENKFDE